MGHLLSKIPHEDKLMFCLTSCCTMIPVRRGLLRDIRKCKQNPSTTTSSIQQETAEIQRPEGAKHQNSRLVSQEPSTENDTEIERLLARMSLGRTSMRWYMLSTCVCLYMLFQLSLIQFQKHEDENTEAVSRQESETSALTRWVTCNGPRLALAGVNEHHGLWLSSLISVLVIFWRFYLLVVEYDFHMDFAVFLLLRQESLKRNVARLDGAKPSVIDRYLRGDELDPIERIMYFKVETYQNRSTGSVTSLEDSGGRVSLASRGQQTRIVKFFVRPNRTPRARRTTFSVLDKYFMTTASISLSALVISTPFSIYSLITQDHLPVKCRIGILNFSSLWRFWSSAFVSLIYLLDSLVATLISTGIIWLIKQDLMVYWTAVEVKINSIYSRMEQFRQISAPRENSTPNLAHIRRKSTMIKHNSSGESQRQAHCRFCQHSLSYQEGCLLKLGSERLEMRAMREALEYDCILLRALLTDFFEQMHRADKYVSLLGPFTLGFTQTMNAVMTLSGSQLDEFDETLGIRCIQFYGFVVASINSYITLDLKRRTDSVYGKLCTLMAADPSANKMRWMPIIEIYTRRRNGFSVLHTSLFTWLLYLKVISYTFTLTLFVENLRMTSNASSIMKAPSALQPYP